MRSVDGPAQAGDYVAIIVMGATLVKVQECQRLLRVCSHNHALAKQAQRKALQEHAL